MKNTKLNAVEILLSDARGIYIPRDFVTDVLGLSKKDFVLDAPDGDVVGMSPDADLTSLNAWGLADQLNSLYDCLNPDGEWYWDAFNTIEASAKHTEGHTLHLDGDLFALDVDNMSREEKRNFDFEVEDIEVELTPITCAAIEAAGYTIDQAIRLSTLASGQTDPEDYSDVQALIRACYNRPTQDHLILVAMNQELELHGVETLELSDGQTFDYLNAGDTYAPTVVMDSEGRLGWMSWGDIAELDL